MSGLQCTQDPRPPFRHLNGADSLMIPTIWMAIPVPLLLSHLLQTDRPPADNPIILSLLLLPSLPFEKVVRCRKIRKGTLPEERERLPQESLSLKLKLNITDIFIPSTTSLIFGSNLSATEQIYCSIKCAICKTERSFPQQV